MKAVTSWWPIVVPADKGLICSVEDDRRLPRRVGDSFRRLAAELRLE